MDEEPTGRPEDTTDDAASAEDVGADQPADDGTPTREVQLDAMGHDKRRQVVGKSYGASKTKQATIYLAFLALIVGLAIGGKLLVDKLDKSPTISNTAPWAQPGAPQKAPKPLQ
jgi:hypothetical protein